MNRHHGVCICYTLAGLVGGILCGRYCTQNNQAPPAPPVPMAQLVEARTKLVENRRIADQALAWLESLPQSLPDNLAEPPYDSVAVFHSIRFFGEIRYAPAIPFLIREGFNNNLWSKNPDAKLSSREPPSFEEEFPIFHALIQIGPPSAAPLVGEYNRCWKLAPGQQRGGYLDMIEITLRRDELRSAALRHIHHLLIKANFGGIDRDELDAVQHLKRKLLQGIE